VAARNLVDKGYPGHRLGGGKIPLKKEYAPDDLLYNEIQHLYKKESARLKDISTLLGKKMSTST
jgi:hypothetical protein